MGPIFSNYCSLPTVTLCCCCYVIHPGTLRIICSPPCVAQILPEHKGLPLLVAGIHSQRGAARLGSLYLHIGKLGFHHGTTAQRCEGLCRLHLQARLATFPSARVIALIRLGSQNPPCEK